MSAPACPVCMDHRVIVGSLPCLPTSAPLRRLPCPRCIERAIDIAHPAAPPGVRSELIEAEFERRYGEPA